MTEIEKIEFNELFEEGRLIFKNGESSGKCIQLRKFYQGDHYDDLVRLAGWTSAAMEKITMGND